jgi:hypothetical protein
MNEESQSLETTVTPPDLRSTSWAAFTLDLSIASLLISTGLVTAEQVCARVDEIQRSIASNPTGGFAASPNVTALLGVFKGALLPVPDGPGVSGGNSARGTLQ